MGADSPPNLQMGWDAWEETFKALIERPCMPFDMWPIYPRWKAWVEFRYGRIPNTGDRREDGAAWAPHCWEAAFRRILMSFQKHGYRPELATGGEAGIQAIIDGWGRIIVCQGNKRTALLRMLNGLDTVVPVKIKRRSPAWEGLKVNLLGGHDTLYQPLPHPDFETMPVVQPCVERRDMMLATEQGEKAKSVLDIGCNTGWFCRMFGERGAYCVGVETNPSCIKMAECMEAYLKCARAKYLNVDLAEFLTQNIEQFDVVLCLSVIMHIFAKHGTDTGWKLMHDLSSLAHTMFLDIAYGGYSGVLPFTEETMPEQVLANTTYTQYKLLGHTKQENRPFYIFWRE